MSQSLVLAAYIDGVRSVLDPNPMPPGLYQYSVVVSTPQREMKFTAPTKERHDIWLSVRTWTGQFRVMVSFLILGLAVSPLTPWFVADNFLCACTPWT
jgi:hypothetical protein